MSTSNEIYGDSEKNWDREFEKLRLEEVIINLNLQNQEYLPLESPMI